MTTEIKKDLQRLEDKMDKIIAFFSIDVAPVRRSARELDDMAKSVALRLISKKKRNKVYDHANS